MELWSTWGPKWYYVETGTDVIVSPMFDSESQAGK